MGSSYQIATIGNSGPQNDFEGAKSGIFNQLWQTKFLDLQTSLTESDQESARTAARVAGYTMYGDFNSAINLPEYNSCDLKIAIGGRKSLLGFAFQKNSLLLTMFNREIQQMLERGEISRIIRKHKRNPPSCGPEKQMSLGFENITSVFIIMAIGLIASVFLISVEWFLNLISQRLKVNNK